MLGIKPRLPAPRPGIVKLLGRILSPGNRRHFPDAISTDPTLRRPAPYPLFRPNSRSGFSSLGAEVVYLAAARACAALITAVEQSEIYVYLRPDALARIAQVQVEVGAQTAAQQTFARALHIAEGLPRNERIHALNYIVGTQAAAGEMAQARATLDRLETSDRQTALANMDQTALADKATAQARTGRFDEARSLAEALTAPGARALVLFKIGIAAAQAGKTMTARQSVAQAFDVAASTPTARYLLQDMVRSIVREGEPQDARVIRVVLPQFWSRFAHGINTARDLTDAKAYVETFFLLLEYGAAAGLGSEPFSEMLQAVQTITDSRWRERLLPYGVRCLAQAQAKAGQIREALDTIKTIPNAYERGPALAAIVTAIAETTP